MGNRSFSRPGLAQAFCDSLEGKGITNATSGLFLAGPRRVGKSTFLREDLIPEAAVREWLPVYVDLWSSRKADPSLLIIEAVKKSITAQSGKLRKLAKKIKLQNVNILGAVALDFDKPGLPENVTLTDILVHLVQQTKRPVLLVIDEAQHALTSEGGINAMFSIKSARDQINLSQQVPQLMLVFTGSNRDKLAQLVVKKDQPFFGSEITPFPLLGKDFTDFFTELTNIALSIDNQFNSDVMWEAFKLTGHRPEVLRQIVGRIAINNSAGVFSEILKEDAALWHTQIWEEFELEFDSLSSLQQAVLSLLIKQGKSWSPFSEESLQYYQKQTKQQALAVSTVQTAIQTLRDRGLIWQSSRGSYALEDENFAEWFNLRVA